MKNQQKWLTKKIPKHWIDKDALLELVIFESLVHYVEYERGLNQSNLDWSEEIEKGYASKEYVEQIVMRESKLRYCYNYIKNERGVLVDKLENIDDFREYEKVETELYDKDSEVMKIIIENRGYLWT